MNTKLFKVNKHSVCYFRYGIGDDDGANEKNRNNDSVSFGGIDPVFCFAAAGGA